MSIEGQGHFFTIFFQVLYVLCFTRPRYQVSVYRTIGPLVFIYFPQNIKIILWVFVPEAFLTEEVLTSTHNLCFRAKLRN